jgi:FkbH-like protein
MNLRTRRLSEKELLDWKSDEKNMIITVKVEDKFGDSGLTGIMSLHIDDNTGIIDDFILSCRVMGRKVEKAMVHYLVNICSQKGLKEIKAVYLKTEKNKPCKDFFDSSGFRVNGNEYSWDVSNEYPCPNWITILD